MTNEAINEVKVVRILMLFDTYLQECEHDELYQMVSSIVDAKLESEVIFDNNDVDYLPDADEIVKTSEGLYEAILEVLK